MTPLAVQALAALCAAAGVALERAGVAFAVVDELANPEPEAPLAPVIQLRKRGGA